MSIDDSDLLGGSLYETADYAAQVADYFERIGLDNIEELDTGPLAAEDDTGPLDDYSSQVRDYVFSHYENAEGEIDLDSETLEDDRDTGTLDAIGDELLDLPDIEPLAGDWDAYAEDTDALRSTDDGEEPYSLWYEIYLADGTVVNGYVTIYHDDTDVEDVIYAANEDIDYGDVTYINYG